MKNLLQETQGVLHNNGKVWEDVFSIESDQGCFSVDEFKRQANKEYDSGIGAAEVDGSLIIVGEDWWLERGEYDGSEWWDFKTLPEKKASVNGDSIWNARYMQDKPEANE